MARFAWLVPLPVEGSGGHRTIFKTIAGLRRAGHACDVYVHLEGRAPGSQTPGILRARIQTLFQTEVDGVIAGYDVTKPYDVAVATVWWSAPFVAGLDAVHKLYFVQDIEGRFFSIGDSHLIALATYDLGLTPIVLGRYLRNYLDKAHCVRAWHMEFGADKTVYRNEDTAREHAVCFLFQPEKPRRCPQIGAGALARLKRRRPDVKVYTYGSPKKPDLPFEFEHLGLLSRQECSALYNRCRVGLCLSTTNPSRIPFEMMACGLPMVDIHGENTIFDLPDSAVVLAQPEPNSIADALDDILNDPDKAAAMSNAGIEFMSDRPEGRETDAFLKAFDAITDGLAPPARDFQPLYREPAFTSRDGMDLRLGWVVEGRSGPDDRTSGKPKSLFTAFADGASKVVKALAGQRRKQDRA